MERHYSVEEAAERLGVSQETVRRWVRLGHIKAVRPGFRAWRIPVSEVARLLAAPSDPSIASDDTIGESRTGSPAAALIA